MLLVALTGGLATGKSFVGAALAGLGCHLIQADELGHKVIEPGGEAYDAVVAEFGREILNPDSTINRRQLAECVFNRPDRLDALTRLVHPRVRARQQRLTQEIAARDPKAIIVVEAAIHIETGGYRNYQKLVLVVCREEQQIERAMRRDGLTREEVEARLGRQLPLREKRKYADYVIDTSGDKEETLAQVRALYNELKKFEAP